MNIRRMADLLWDHFITAGFDLWASSEFGDDCTVQEQLAALASTAKATYVQFCLKHNLPTGIEE